MLWYRIMRSVAEGFPYVVLWCYVAAFALALVLMVIHPLGTIVLLWMGLVSLVFVVGFSKLLRIFEHWFARRAMAGGLCPQCGLRRHTEDDSADEWRCEACAARFDGLGVQQPSPVLSAS